MINNRQQSGRRRGRGGQRQNGGGNGNSGGRSLDNGNRIDNRARGNAAQLLEKYKTLARDAQQAGDRVLTEYYHQFADHYFRVLAETRARYEEANPNRRPQGEYAADDGYDSDGETDGDDGDTDNFGEFDAPRQQQRSNRDGNRDGGQRDGNQRDGQRESGQRESGQRDNNQRQYRDRDDRPQQQDRQDRPQREERSYRDDRPQRDDTQRDSAPRDDRPQQRDDRPQREDRQRPLTARPRTNGNGAVNGNVRDDEDVGGLPFDALPPAIGATFDEPMDLPMPDLPMGVEGEAIPVPKRRGRPKKVVTEAATEE